MLWFVDAVDAVSIEYDEPPLPSAENKSATEVCDEATVLSSRPDTFLLLHEHTPIRENAHVLILHARSTVDGCHYPLYKMPRTLGFHFSHRHPVTLHTVDSIMRGVTEPYYLREDNPYILNALRARVHNSRNELIDIQPMELELLKDVWVDIINFKSLARFIKAVPPATWRSSKRTEWIASDSQDHPLKIDIESIVLRFNANRRRVSFLAALILTSQADKDVWTRVNCRFFFNYIA